MKKKLAFAAAAIAMSALMAGPAHAGNPRCQDPVTPGPCDYKDSKGQTATCGILYFHVTPPSGDVTGCIS